MSDVFFGEFKEMLESLSEWTYDTNLSEVHVFEEWWDLIQNLKIYDNLNFMYFVYFEQILNFPKCSLNLKALLLQESGLWTFWNSFLNLKKNRNLSFLFIFL